MTIPEYHSPPVSLYRDSLEESIVDEPGFAEPDVSWLPGVVSSDAAVPVLAIS